MLFTPILAAATLTTPVSPVPSFETPPLEFRMENPRMIAWGWRGIASWYGPGFIGRRTANGEVYCGTKMTAAHKTLPFGTRVRVHNLNNGRSAVVRINDRGPFVGGRVIDLSSRAARVLGVSGLANVRLEVLR